jgi:hypothetical protein
MLVLGGRNDDGEDIIGFEAYDAVTNSWIDNPNWQMAQGRYRYTNIYILLTLTYSGIKSQNARKRLFAISFIYNFE